MQLRAAVWQSCRRESSGAIEAIRVGVQALSQSAGRRNLPACFLERPLVSVKHPNAAT
jgi:hypothetical protein